MKTVKLRNGTEEAEPLVVVTMMSLERLTQEMPIVMYELVMKCRDSNHKLFGRSGDTLRSLSLINEDGSIHDSVRNIVLSYAEGEGLDMTFVNPIAV